MEFNLKKQDCVDAYIPSLKTRGFTRLVVNYSHDEVYVKAIYKIPSLIKYKRWTKVSRFLAYGLQGVEIRETKMAENGLRVYTKFKIKPEHD